ncbi:FAD-dependent oxidoreductase [Calorimonas adulescens]|uniref:FAD-dependent oxidoreductase n=1 Tax=Calorimonas adulescens TaxID=2606906 RepID=A0A5D8QGQ9_9THEO|nr:FAD-dependent oxidoreductase [Calorimonas adulescens]TZE82438.1 FAD-dependent oxidoreductase [Calorimonas adulescens]
MNTLFDEIKIGNMVLKNRIVMTPMGFPATDLDCGVSQREMDYYVERAKGGFGLIFLPCHVVTDKYETVACVNLLTKFTHSVRLATAIEKIHHYGAKVCIQLSMGMGRVSLIDPFTAPYSSSAIPSFWFKDLICKPLSKEQIKDIVKSFGYAAFLAKRAGADAVEIHAYGGYLIDQFITSIWNKRTDEYGGSLENRLRIVFELRDEIWKNCGKDFPISIKFTPVHGFEGGRTLEEGLEIAKIFDNSGFSLLHVDFGSYECQNKSVTTVYEKEGLQLHIAEALKKAGIKTPILGQGKLGRPEFAKEVIEKGIIDLLGLGHTSIAEPYWPNKVKDGKLDDVRPCIGCNECVLRASNARPLSCTVNPYAGFEKDYVLTPAKDKKSILIVGGGPGGIMAALTADQRGFDVELWEKNSELGGALLAAGAPEFKRDVARYVSYLKAQIAKSNVKVILNKEATSEEILARKPDVVILAGGAEPIVPNIPGINSDRVILANDLLRNKNIDGEKIVVVGGGLVGCEAALMLDNMGKKVTIVEMLDKLLATAVHAYQNHISITEMLNASNIQQMTKTSLKSIDAGSVTVEKDGREIAIECDRVVLAIGYKPNLKLKEALEGKIEKVFTIGDNVKAGKIIDATHQGFHIIRLLEEL